MKNKAKGKSELFVSSLNKCIDEIPGFLEKRYSPKKSCDLINLKKIVGNITSEGLLFHSTNEQLDIYIEIGIELLTRIHYARYEPENIFFIVDQILDSIWHQKKVELLSKKNKRNLAKFALEILDEKNKKYWIDSLSPSSSWFNHCIYFIFMLEDRFRNENGEFLAIYANLKYYIEKYGNHHLTLRWNVRYNTLK